MLWLWSKTLNDLDPGCGLAFGRLAWVGVDGRLTGDFISFSLLLGLALVVRKTMSSVFRQDSNVKATGTQPCIFLGIRITLVP